MASTTDDRPPTMRAWAYTSRGTPRSVLSLTTVPTPPRPWGTSVLVKVTHCALNPAGHVMMSLIPHLPFFSEVHRVPELDFAGSVVAAGPEATIKVGAQVFGRMAQGDMMAGRGALAEYVTVEEIDVVIVPEGMKMEEASGMLTTGLTAAQMLKVSGVREGDRVLVNGASGGVGMMVVQIAKASGLRVVGVCSGANEDAVRELGADDVIDYRQKTPLQAYLTRNYGDRPFDAILDCIGTQDLFNNSPSYLKDDGTYVNVGAYDGSKPYVAWCLFQNILWPRLLGGTPRKYVFHAASADPIQARFLRHLYEQGKLRVPIDSVFDMEQGLDAYDKLMTKRARGKVVIKVQD